MPTRIMESRVLRQVLLSRLVVAVGVASAIPGCEVEPEYERDNLSLRSHCYEGEDVDDQAQPGPIEDIDGGASSGCSECGSHWTTLDGGDKLVHLSRDLGDRVLGLADLATFFARDGYGTVRTTRANCDGDGYSVLVRSWVPYTGDVANPDFAVPSRAFLRFEYNEPKSNRKTPVTVQLSFIDNKTAVFTDPPVSE